jgi:hypothetical protein
MMRSKRIIAAAAVIFGVAVAGAALADVEDRLDRRGDRIDQRLDRKGDRIDSRLDRRGDRADNRLDRRGDRIDRKLDRRGQRRANRRAGGGES